MKRFKKVLVVLLGFFIFLIGGCASTADYFNKIEPITSPISKMDFPVYFGKPIKVACAEQKTSDALLSVVETTQTSPEEESNEVSYYNEVNDILEKYDLNDYKVFIQESTVYEHNLVFLLLIYPSRIKNDGIKNRIVGCKEK